MGYTMHEMNVLLFSKEDAVFGDTDVASENDNEWSGDGEYTYTDSDTKNTGFDW